VKERYENGRERLNRDESEKKEGEREREGEREKSGNFEIGLLGLVKSQESSRETLLSH